MQRNIIIGTIVLIVLGVLAYIQMTNTQNSKKNDVTQTGDIVFPTSSAASQSAGPEGKLLIQDIKEGTGSAVKAGDKILIHYTGMLTNGQKFDSSLDRGQPFETRIGIGMVIKGWDEGAIGMKVGGKRRLIIPPELGYGATGAGNVIPPNATLIFDLELLGIK